MGGRGLPEDPACVHTCRLKWLRLGLMRLAFKDPWGRMPSWIGAKVGQLIPLLVFYLFVKFRGNPSSMQ